MNNDAITNDTVIFTATMTVGNLLDEITYMEEDLEVELTQHHLDALRRRVEDMVQVAVESFIEDFIEELAEDQN